MRWITRNKARVSVRNAPETGYSDFGATINSAANANVPWSGNSTRTDARIEDPYTALLTVLGLS